MTHFATVAQPHFPCLQLQVHDVHPLNVSNSINVEAQQRNLNKKKKMHCFHIQIHTMTGICIYYVRMVYIYIYIHNRVCEMLIMGRKKTAVSHHHVF